MKRPGEKPSPEREVHSEYLTCGRDTHRDLPKREMLWNRN